MASSKLALLESRVDSLEAEVERLKINVSQSGSPTGDWVDQMYGLFADYPDFDKVIELGKKYRESLRAKTVKSKSSRPPKGHNR